MFRQVGKLDLTALCRRINANRNCSVIINRHYQCGEQGVYGFRNKQTVPFKCELNLLNYNLFIFYHFQGHDGNFCKVLTKCIVR